MAVVNAIYKGISRKEAIPSVESIQQIKTVFNQCIQYRKEKTERKQQKISIPLKLRISRTSRLGIKYCIRFI